MLLQIVGGGKMGEALLRGLITSDWAQPAELHVVEANAQRRDQLSADYPGISVSDTVGDGADALISVKPQHVTEVVAALASNGVSRLVSVAAGITVSAMEAAGPGIRVVRCMPNTPALVGEGASAIAGGATATDDDLAWAESILAAVGDVERVSEPDLDAVTGLSGSGPAYVFHLAEALIAAGIAQGLSPEIADRLARQTILGAATLLHESGEDPGVLRENVTSPGGTTAAGLAVFAEEDFTGLVDRVVRAAVARSRELGTS